jgi:hypothetical protein
MRTGNEEGDAAADRVLDQHPDRNVAVKKLQTQRPPLSTNKRYLADFGRD